MRLYHLGSSRYANQLTGEGARLFGGRWNLQGDACLYTLGSRSLSILEYLANVTIENLPPSLAITEYFVPDSLCHLIASNSLPADWSTVPAPASCKIFGSRLLADRNCTCFAVPSVIVPAELNYIINPDGNEFGQLKIVGIEPFNLDMRIKK